MVDANALNIASHQRRSSPSPSRSSHWAFRKPPRLVVLLVLAEGCLYPWCRCMSLEDEMMGCLVKEQFRIWFQCGVVPWRGASLSESLYQSTAIIERKVESSLGKCSGRAGCTWNRAGSY